MTAKPKILCVHQGYELYGSDKMFIETLRAVRSQWPEADITARIPRDGPLKDMLLDRVDDVKIGDLWVLRRANIKWRNWRSILSLFPLMYRALHEMREYDLIYINTMMVWSHILVNRFHKKPSIIHIHENSSGVVGFFLNIMAFIAGGDFIANARRTFDSYKLIFSFRKHLVYNGVPEITQKPQPPRLKRTLNLLHVGRFNDFKGQDVLIKAISRMPKDYRSRIKIRLVGSVFDQQTFYLDDLKALIKDLKAEKQIEILPFTHDLSDYYQWADCIILCSKSPKETFGLTVAEGMSYARPAIVSDIGGLPELVASGENGLLVKPNDVWSLRDALIHYLNYPKEIQTHGAQAYKVFQDKFCLKIYNKKITDVFNHILNDEHRSTIWHLYAMLLRKAGKNYDPDPNVSDRVLLGSLLSRFAWLMRGFIRFRKKVFIARDVSIRGKENLTMGEYTTINRGAQIDAVAKNQIVFGDRVSIGPFVEISCTSHFSKLGKGIKIGDDSAIGGYSFIGASGGVEIGSNVIMGQYVTFHAQDHIYKNKDKPIKDQGVTEKGIVIGDDCWIGAKVTFLDGAELGNRCVVAAGSVVKGKFPDHSMIGGVPAKVIKEI